MAVLKHEFYRIRRRFKRILKVAFFPLSLPYIQITGLRKRNNVCLFHAGRSGSTILAHMLSKHPKITWSGKIITQFLYDHQETYLTPEHLKKIIRFHKMGVLRRYFCFEIEMENLEHIEGGLKTVISALSDLRIDHVILLERKNYLRSIVSRIKAKRTGQWHVRQHEKAIKDPVSINVGDIYNDGANTKLQEELEAYRNFYRELNESLSSFDFKTLQMTYEESIKESPEKGYREVLNFLNLPYKKVALRFKKASQSSLRETIGNYNEVEKVLQSTPFGSMIHD